MFITILDYSRQSLCFIEDAEDVTKHMSNESVEDILYTLGFKDSQISYMVSKENPCENISATTLRELLSEVDEDVVERLQERINYRWDG